MKRRVLLVDDHPILREGLRGLIDQQTDLEACGEAADVESAMKALRETNPDVLVADISLGKESGLDLVQQARALLPALPILVLSMHDEMIYAERALRSGAGGYIMKQEATEHVIAALRSVLDGRMFVSPAVTDRLLNKLAHPQAARPSYSVDRLTNRELEVFRLIGTGVTSADIAQDLHISRKTVETHRTRIKEKLGASTAAELFQAFADAGEWDVICYAHCGGRYADIRAAHDGRFEKSVEVHSSWGTFEWLLHDAFELGYRVGIVANSDGHKGRPGASYPGASMFGAIGRIEASSWPWVRRYACNSSGPPPSGRSTRWCSCPKA